MGRNARMKRQPSRRLHPRLDTSARRAFLPGKTTAGHYQIELRCDVCHTPMMGVKQQACLDCHEQELDRADDSHTPSKFRDPRRAMLVERLNARKCITSHVEHQPHRTHAMGVTQPTDYCYHCHQDIGENRPTHKGLGDQFTDEVRNAWATTYRMIAEVMQEAAADVPQDSTGGAR